jgi:quercetin 2,3-dioxygenase
MSEIVLETIELGFQWPTIDPFLFCVHHDDDYPEGNVIFGPDPANFVGREMGSDFAGIDGWRMYHGDTVPGFPQHPHRGFETLTIVREGLCDHSDSLGAKARFGSGDAQWITAGKGIVHSEMFPMLRSDARNPLELFQIWVNLPARSKMVDPHFTMLWAADQPVLKFLDGDGFATNVTVIAGVLNGSKAPTPPPNSWASKPESDVSVLLIELEPNATWTIPKAIGAQTIRMLYFYEGSSVVVGGTKLSANTGARVRADLDSELRAGADGASILMLQGTPIAEPVAQHGPFVMNTRAEIAQAFEDYQRTRFGGWPWPADDPNHGADPARFAIYPNGTEERPTAVS